MHKNSCLYCCKPLNGALDFHATCSKVFFGTNQPPIIPYSFNQMSTLAKQVVERSITIPGVQPKLSMSLIKDVEQKDNFRLTVVGALGGQYIFKPPSHQFPEMPANEHATMRLAEIFGIKTADSSLIKLASGELAYITKRMDRTSTGAKIHMLDMFQITEAFDKYKSSMEKVGKALDKFSTNTLLDKLFYFELALFSFLTGNNDMHLKNFSMVETGFGWLLAPAYDLLNVSIVFPNDDEELALTLCGKKKNIKKADFVHFGNTLNLTDKQIDGVFKRFLKKRIVAEKWIKASFLSEKMTVAYVQIMEKRYAILV